MPQSSQRQQKRIAVIGTPVLTAHSRFNEALIRYASDRGRWRFVFTTEASVAALRFLRQLDCDGALVRLVSPDMAREARQLDLPMVNVSGWLKNPGVPTVCGDSTEYGRACARHLLERGFRRFGIVTTPAGWFIEERRRSFCKTVDDAGFGSGISEFNAASQPVAAADLKRFRLWLAKLQLPVGLFLADDLDAHVLMSACREAGRRIPQDVAVVAGLGHVETLPLCQPSLSHVWGNDEEIATRAAECLDELMAGKSREPRTLLVPPQRLVAQESTDTVAVDDRLVARIIEHIRAHVAQGANVKDIARHLGVPRRTLDRRFRQAMGGSIHDFLVRERVGRAQDLLRGAPALTLKEIARRCGFASVRRLNLVFHRSAGVRPAEVRRRGVAKKST